MSPLFSASSVVDLRVGGLAHVAEQVRAELVGRILARRHLLHDDVRQLEVEPPGGDRRHLRERRVLDDDDGPVGRLAPVAIDDLAHVPLVHAGHGGQQADRPIEIRRVQPDDRDVERRPVLDEHAAVAVEEHAARRAQRQLALMVVLGHLAELLVLDDLEEPERAGEEQEARDGGSPAAW